MRYRTVSTLLITMLLVLPAAGLARDRTPGAESAPPGAVPVYTARLLRSFEAAEADQGAAVDAEHFYAIDNHSIGKYRKADGVRVGGWEGGDDGPIRHINSCYTSADRLHCANSNWPEIPMASSLEWFDTATLRHVETRSLGISDEGSLTWFQPLDSGWLACFAHYDSPRGVPFKGQRFTSIVRFDTQWRRTGGWMLPDPVLERMAPHSASGGVIGPDGLLYLTGHDRTEMYVLAPPRMGPKLEHLATVEIPAHGQAFDWDRSAGRLVYAVDRRRSRVLVFEVPEIPVPEGTRRFDPPR